MAYCLPPKLANAFVAKLKDGTINPTDLVDMTSAERRKFFTPIVGAENAEGVNALFESKLLLKDVKRGLVTWAKTVGGITEPTRKDLLAKIGRMPTELLNPVDQSKFLADLAATKLGVTVTADEAKQIFDLAQAAEAARAARTTNDAVSWKAYGEAVRNLEEYTLSLKPGITTWKDYLLQGAAQTIRAVGSAMVTTADLSVMTQLIARVSTKEWFEAAFKMHKWFADQKNFDDLMSEIRGNPNYQLHKDLGIAYSEMHGDYLIREEMAPPKFLEDFNAYLRKVGPSVGGRRIPNVIRAANRAFVGPGNYLRYKAIESAISAARLMGLEISKDTKYLRDMAEVINNTTARGRWGKPGGVIEKTGPAASLVLFASRKFAADIRLFNPIYYLDPRIHPKARMEQLRHLVGMMATVGLVASMFKLAGYDVENNPIATNFMRVGSGDTQFDFTSGKATMVRFIARFITGYSESARGNVTEYGEGFKPATRWTAFIDLLRQRFAPWASSLATAAHGTDPLGRPFSVTQEVANNTIPMVISNFIELAMSDPDIGAIMLSPLSIYGAGMQVQNFGPPKSRWDALGAPEGTDQSANPVQRALDRVGVELNMPERMIRGVKLDDAMYDEYVQRAGKAVQQELASVLRTTNISRLPIGRQEDLIRSHVANAREHARGIMIGRHPELLREAKRVKDARRQTGSAAAQARRAQ